MCSLLPQMEARTVAVSIAEWDALTESHRELERYAREATTLLDLPTCRFCERPGVVRITDYFTVCGSCAEWHFGSTYMEGWS